MPSTFKPHCSQDDAPAESSQGINFLAGAVLKGKDFGGTWVSKCFSLEATGRSIMSIVIGVTEGSGTPEMGLNLMCFSPVIRQLVIIRIRRLWRLLSRCTQVSPPISQRATSRQRTQRYPWPDAPAPRVTHTIFIISPLFLCPMR